MRSRNVVYHAILSCLLVFCLSTVCVLAGCSQKDPNRKPTSPVTGTVYVDGQPAVGVQIMLTDTRGMDSAKPTVSTSITKEGGAFSVSTYDESDGVPPGEYVLTFTWGEYDVFSRSYRDDKLKKRYIDPAKSETRITVVEGQPVEMGRIDLKTR